MVCDHVQIIDKGKLVFNGGIDVLKRSRLGNKLLVGFNHAPQADALLKIKGVTETEVLESGMVRVRFAEGENPSQSIVESSVKNGWGLYQIAPDQTSLEDVFVQLTYHDAAEAA